MIHTYVHTGMPSIQNGNEACPFGRASNPRRKTVADHVRLFGFPAAVLLVSSSSFVLFSWRRVWDSRCGKRSLEVAFDVEEFEASEEDWRVWRFDWSFIVVVGRVEFQEVCEVDATISAVKASITWSWSRAWRTRPWRSPQSYFLRRTLQCSDPSRCPPRGCPHPRW